MVLNANIDMFAVCCLLFALSLTWLCDTRVGHNPDYLQAPLQPLMDNLESQTYEAFEKDPVKYSQYEKAIVKALELREEKDVTVLMVSPHVHSSMLPGIYIHTYVDVNDTVVWFIEQCFQMVYGQMWTARYNCRASVAPSRRSSTRSLDSARCRRFVLWC